MARKFSGKNKIQSAKQLWYARANYQINAYPQNNGDGGKEVKDLLFFERMYYGMIDMNDESIIPNQDFLRPLDSTTPLSIARSPVAMDFVADAFLDLKNLIERACQAQLLTKGVFAPLVPVRAYTSPKNAYRQHFERILTIMNSKTLPNLYDINSIITFDDYVKTFINYMENNPNDHILTFTKWCRSSQSSVFNSGLAIAIADFKIGTDQEKISEFIDGKFYPFYQNAVLNSGFSTMKNAPWILVADLTSPAMSRFLSPAPYRITRLDQIFSSRYIKTLYIERNILSDILLKYYNFFVIQNPRAKKLTVCNNKTSQSYISRKNLEYREFFSNFGEDYWIDVQVQLKNIEDRVGFSPQKIRNIQNKAKNLLKTVDKDKASGYIIKEFGNQTWNKDYGFGDLVQHQLTSDSRPDVKAQQKIMKKTRGGSSGGSSY